MKTSVEPLKLMLDICTSITSCFLNLKSTVVEYRCKINRGEKTVNVHKRMKLIDLTVSAGSACVTGQVMQSFYQQRVQ